MPLAEVGDHGANTAAGNDSVALGARCRYVLGAPDNYWYGPNGLPPIASDITIEGNGATIARAPSAPPVPAASSSAPIPPARDTAATSRPARAS